jgi:DNA mismatch repair protein MutL
VREVLAETMEESRAAKALPKRLRAKLLETIACRAAVKLGKHFSPEEAVAFFRQAANLRNVQTCPHGRPTSVDINVADIERKLSRR